MRARRSPARDTVILPFFKLQLEHFAMAVAAERYDAYIERLRAGDANLTRQPFEGKDGLKRAFVEDADGNRVEITNGSLRSD